MHADFWLEKWRDGQTYFHRAQVNPLLQKYWPSLAVPQGSRVLVPLCGKSLDMIWLTQQGLRVLGIELSQMAVEQFFAGNGLHPAIHQSALGSHYVAGNIEIICSDIFKVDAATLSSCTAIYDCAAMVALPPDMRERYVGHVYAQLPDQYRGLLITLDYAQDQMKGPPFSVPDAEVQALLARHSEATIVDRHDILAEEPRFAQRGVAKLDTVTYRLQGRAADER